MSDARELPQVVALRNQILSTGRLTGRLRRNGAVAGAVGAPLLFGLGFFLLNRVAPDRWAEILGFTLFGLALGLAVGVPVSVLLFYQRRRRVRWQLARLSREEQLAALLPLRGERGDTRRLIAPLLRELRPPRELTASTAPEGRGDEASPAGRMTPMGGGLPRI